MNQEGATATPPEETCWSCGSGPCRSLPGCTRGQPTSRDLTKSPAALPREASLEALLEHGLRADPAIHNASGVERYVDLSALDKKQVAFVREFFGAGPSQYHVGRSCTEAGVSRRMYYHWLDTPDFREAVESIDAYQVDSAEAVVSQLVAAGDLNAARFLLERRSGRKWGPRAQLDVTSGGEPVGFRIEIVPPASATGGTPTETPQP